MVDSCTAWIKLDVYVLFFCLIEFLNAWLPPQASPWNIKEPRRFISSWNPAFWIGTRSVISERRAPKQIALSDISTSVHMTCTESLLWVINTQHLRWLTLRHVCYTIYLLAQSRLKRNYFLFHQSYKIGRGGWRGHSQICLQMTRDRQFRYSLQTVIGQIWHIYLWDACYNIGLRFLCGAQQCLKMVSCPTVGSVMMANGGSSRACLSAVISCDGSHAAIFFCSSTFWEMRWEEVRWPLVCSLSPACPLP